MRRFFVFSLICMCCYSSAFCQFLVDSLGNVGVKAGNGNISSYFTINNTGSSGVCTYFLANNLKHDTGLLVRRQGPVNTTYDYSIAIRDFATAEFTSMKKNYGVLSIAHKANGYNSDFGRCFGVYGLGGNATPGWNYGVFGTLFGANNGAGVFGSSVEWDGGMNTWNKYAGYFHGIVKVTDDITATSFIVSSDYRLKENIKAIETDCIDGIMNMNVVSYNLKQRIVDTGDTTTVSVNYYTNVSDLLKKKHYGLIAQELQQIYPDLVYEEGDGYLSINYTEIIPLLIRTIQELKLEVDDLKNNANRSMSRGAMETIQATDRVSSVVLFQNDPNPFTENTAIMCFIPKDIVNAVLYIYDLNGRQIESRNISERGNTNIIIEGNSLDAGIYIYSLIADGVVVDTKRMILTK